MKKRKRFLSIRVGRRKMCTEGFLCVNDAWKGILVRVSNECTFVYKCVLWEMKNL